MEFQPRGTTHVAVPLTSDLAAALNRGALCTFNFRLNYIQIDNTISLEEDTDHVYFNAKIGATKVDAPVVHMGDVNSGQYPLNLVLGPLTINDPADPVVIGAQVLNSSDDTARVEAGLIRAGVELLDDTDIAPPWTTIAAKLAELIFRLFPGILPGGCNGYAVSDKKAYTAGELWTECFRSSPTTGGFGLEDDYVMVNAPTGCRRSHYKVSYGFQAQAVEPTPFAPTPGQYYNIVSQISGKVIGVAAGSPADGAQVVQWHGDGTLNQQWQFADAGGGYYNIVAKHSGKLLNVAGASQDPGANVIQWPKAGTDNEEWQMLSTGDGYYNVVAEHSGQFLSIAGDVNDPESWVADGAKIIQFSNRRADNAKWQFVAITPPPPPN